MTLEDAMRFVKQIASGLAHVHTKRIIHRDLHSGNVLVCAAAGGPDSLQLTDFGLARAFNADSGKEVAMSTTIVGGCNCPPEIVFATTKRVHYTSALDAWCLGALLWTLETGGMRHSIIHMDAKASVTRSSAFSEHLPGTSFSSMDGLRPQWQRLLDPPL